VKVKSSGVGVLVGGRIGSCRLIGGFAEPRQSIRERTDWTDGRCSGWKRRERRGGGLVLCVKGTESVARTARITIQLAQPAERKGGRENGRPPKTIGIFPDQRRASINRTWVGLPPLLYTMFVIPYSYIYYMPIQSIIQNSRTEILNLIESKNNSKN
jgi:hypothetical protein